MIGKITKEELHPTLNLELNHFTTHLANEAVHLKAGERPKWDSVANRYSLYCQTITDWNNAVTNGMYMGSNVANAPSGDWFMGEVIAHDTNYIEQRISSFASTQLKFVRRKIGGTWSHWMRDGFHMLRHYVIRDATLTGNLVLPHSTGKIPAAINIQTHINGSKKASWGWWDGSQYCMYTNEDSGVFYIGTAPITMENASGHYTAGYVDWVNKDAIGLLFTHGGNGATGSMNISIQLFFGEGR